MNAAALHGEPGRPDPSTKFIQLLRDLIAPYFTLEHSMAVTVWGALFEYETLRRDSSRRLLSGKELHDSGLFNRLDPYRRLVREALASA